MPRYAFACPACHLEFEVSRPMTEAGAVAKCPADGTEATRIFTMPATIVGGRPAVASSRRVGSSSYGHHGHRHGPGTAPHSH